MKVIILLGAPGAGKGTIAERIRDMCSLVHVSTGDMLRSALKNGTEIGKLAESYMKKGELVPDDVIIKLVDQRFEESYGTEIFMFDGFPRTNVQAELLDASLTKHGGHVDTVFLLEASREVLIQRLTGRRVCRRCGATFHIVNIPPKMEGVCDVCGGELYQRADDAEETILNRLDVYKRQTESLIETYEKRGILVRIQSGEDSLFAASQMVEVIGKIA